jgi:hypothetical protein
MYDQTKKRVSICASLMGFTLIMILFYGCREPVIDHLERETGTYSLYGAMDLHSNSHTFRVKDLKREFRTGFYELDVTVYFDDLESGTTEILRDSVVAFSDNYTHNYLLNKKLEPRNTYRIRVDGPDGRSVSSQATTPGIARVFIDPYDNIPKTPFSCFFPMAIHWRNVEPDEQIRYWVDFEYNGTIYSSELTGTCPKTYYPEFKELILYTDTRILLNWVFPPDGGTPRCRNPVSPKVSCNELSSDNVVVRYRQLGPDWKSIYPVINIDPRYSGDVENGIGFVGAYREESVQYVIIQD